MSATPARRAIVIASICTAIGVAIAAGLGIWQLQRLAWKQDILARIEQRIHADPVRPDALDQQIQRGEDVEYTRVKVRGYFDHDREIHIYAPGPEGPGWQLVTLFKESRGRLYFVNRGYVAESRLADAARPQGEVDITGLLRPYDRRNAFTPDNDVTGNTWYWYDYEAMQRYVYETWQQRNAVNIFPDVIEQEAVSGMYPAGGVTILDIPNNHLQYALTWFGLMLALIGVYAVWLLRQLRER